MAHQDGRTVVVTGASSGIGAATAHALAASGARVILGVRDPAKWRAVAATMAGRPQGAPGRPGRPGLGTPVRRHPARGHRRAGQQNGGIMSVLYQRTADDVEAQLATNLLGPFALTGLLLPRIRDRVLAWGSVFARP